jgi:hypothetical protein
VTGRITPRRPAAVRSALLFAALLIVALAPQPAIAACGVQDPAGCVDGALYNFWYGIAGLGWALDRTLLLLAYQLDIFRWWLVEVAFTSAYQLLVQIVDPLLVPFATFAVILGCLAVLLLPVFGRTNLVSVRHALVWTVLAPMLLTVSGPLIVQLEQLRSDVGVALFDGVSQLAPGAIFGAASGDMRAPAALYPANPCGGATLTRRTAGQLRTDDLAAALLWADAEDIHCPEAGGPSADVPDLFFDAAPDGAGYARDENIAQMNAGNVRAQAVLNMQRGAVRTFLGLLPSTLAVLDALVQLLFALCLVALWISLPIGLLFVFFADTASAVTGLGRRFLGVLQVSWSSSVLLGIVSACLIAAAELRNAAAYTGFSIAGLALTGYMLLIALDTLKGCVRTVNDTFATVTGLSVTQPFALARDAATSLAGAGLAVVSGGAGAAVTAAAALHQSGSGRYATAAALGRIRPLAQLGEVASAMGYVDDEEVLAGLHAGERSTVGSWRGTRLQMVADASRRDDAGLTFRDRARERAVTRELQHTGRPTVIRDVEAIAGAGRAVYDYVGSAEMADHLYHFGDGIPATVDAGWQRVRSTWRDFQTGIDTRSDGSTNLVRRSLAAAQVVDEHLRPRPHQRVLFLDTKRHVRTDVPPSPFPDHAFREPQQDVHVPRLLMLGYAVLPNEDKTVSFWRRESSSEEPVGAPRPQPAARNRRAPDAEQNSEATRSEERERLVRAGAVQARPRTPGALTPESAPVGRDAREGGDHA